MTAVRIRQAQVACPSGPHQLACPDAEPVITWNASENRHMLAINISL